MPTPRDPALLARAVLGVRLIGLACLVWGLQSGLTALLQTWEQFNPTFLGYFLRQVLLEPGVLALSGALLILLARPLATQLTPRSGTHPNGPDAP